jgi:hypothetical protein
MFRASPDSSQIDLFSNIEQFLRERDQVKLNDPNAWHNVFLDQVTKRIPESALPSCSMKRMVARTRRFGCWWRC